MSLRLYEITEELEALDGLLDSWASHHEGDITDFPLNDELDRLEEEKREKLLNLALYIKSLNAESKAFKEEKNRLQAKERTINNKIERLKSYLECNINEGEKIESTKATISWRRSSRVVVECMLEDLPEVYVKVEKSARLKDLEHAIKQGEEFEGVSIREFQNLQIK